MPPKKKPGKKRAAPKPKTKADRKHYKGNGGARCKEDEIPVKRKKRKTQSASSSPRPPSTHTPPDGKRTKGATTPPPNAQSKEEAFVPSRAFMLAAAVLCGCDHGIWYRLAPDLEKRDDLSVATRHSWQNIFATFIEAGLFGTRQVDELGIEHRVEVRSKPWDLMIAHMKDQHGIKVEITSITPRRRRKSWFVILKNADSEKAHEFSNPIVQQERTRERESLVPALIGSLLRNRKKADCSLKEQLDTLRKEVESKNLLYRLKDLDTDKWDAIIEAAAKMGTLKNHLLRDLSVDDMSNVDINAPVVVKAAAKARNDMETQIDDALSLQFDVRIHGSDLRPSRMGNGNDGIEVGTRKQASERMRSCAVFLSELWGYRDTNKSWDERQRIATAACNLIAYDHGYPRSTGSSQLGKWYDQAKKDISAGKSSALSRTFIRRVSYTDGIEAAHPGYLHELYRYAVRTRGILATFAEITETMNSKSATSDEIRPTLRLHRLQMYRWFICNNGKELSAKEKPLLTNKLKAERVAWVGRWGDLFRKEDTPVCYLDEKWFYTSSRRRKIKYLPPGPGEEADDALIVRPKIRSRRYPVKVMYLGVVARPVKDEAKGIDFNGRIALKRVARERKVKSLTRNQKFSPDVKVNDEIKKGGWKEFYDEGMTAEELFDVVSEYYDLSEHVTDRLELNYLYNKGATRKKFKKIAAEEVVLPATSPRKKRDGTGALVPVTLNDLELCVRYQNGDMVEEDVSCDSTWMKDNMDDIATSIRAAYHWLNKEDVIYLVMDNAGGHGTDECVDEYTKGLLDKHSIQIVQQVARSPETNVLDLGIWMSLQSAVEKKHKGRCCNPEVLNKTVMEVWDDVASVDAFKNVFGKLPKIYSLILMNEGGNDLVETNRGKKGVAEMQGDASHEGGDDANNNDATATLEDYIDYAQGLVEADVVGDDDEEDDALIEHII
mmetsp:Transcript_22699/g.53836  ORF Transcript_22699/g.53836 Transcript_22699/m.53836 type:complete len:948 (+) Transcript_22699:244-3087(+)